MRFLLISLLLMFLLVNSVTLTNLTYAQIVKEDKKQSNVKELKINLSSSSFKGDPCDEDFYVPSLWKLVDEKWNTPTIPLYMILEISLKGEKGKAYVMVPNITGVGYQFVSKYDDHDERFKKRYGNLNIESSESFVFRYPGHRSSSEQILTFKPVKIGPTSSGYVYSGPTYSENTDQITVKIPACKKLQLKVTEKSGTYKGDPCDENIAVPVQWKLVDGEKNTPKVPLNMVIETWEGKERSRNILISNTGDGYQFVSLDYDSDGDLRKQYDLRLKKKIKDAFNLPYEVNSSSSEQVLTFKIAKIGSVSDHSYSGNGDPVTVKIPACKKESSKNTPDLVVKSTSIKHDGTYFIFTWYFEPIKNHPMIGDLSDTKLNLDFVVRVTEGNGKPRLSHVSGSTNEVSISVIDSGEDIKAADLELVRGKNSDTSMFDDVLNAKPLSIKGKNLQPLKIIPPKITSNDQWKYVPSVLKIGEHAYPIEQFMRNPPGVCMGDHYSTKSGYAVSLDLHAIEDPSPSGCRFGMTSIVNPGAEYATKAQILAWEKVTGLNIKADD